MRRDYHLNNANINLYGRIKSMIVTQAQYSYDPLRLFPFWYQLNNQGDNSKCTMGARELFFRYYPF